MNAPDQLPLGMQPLQGTLLSLAQVRLSKLALLLGDALALLLAFGVSALLVVGLQGVDWRTWWQGQDSQRFVAWVGIATLGLTLLLMRFQHYSDRRPFWDELGDLLQLTVKIGRAHV